MCQLWMCPLKKTFMLFGACSNGAARLVFPPCPTAGLTGSSCLLGHFPPCPAAGLTGSDLLLVATS